MSTSGLFHDDPLKLMCEVLYTYSHYCSRIRVCFGSTDMKEQVSTSIFSCILCIFSPLECLSHKFWSIVLPPYRMLIEFPLAVLEELHFYLKSF